MCDYTFVPALHCIGLGRPPRVAGAAFRRMQVWLRLIFSELNTVVIKNTIPPIHAGEILQEEFLAPLKLSANKLAAALGVPTNRITAIIKGQRGITGDTALRLAEYFSTTPQFWMNLQSTYELRLAETTLAPEVRKSIRAGARVLETAGV
jgi:addiction module HigA family antidote